MHFLLSFLVISFNSVCGESVSDHSVSDDVYDYFMHRINQMGTTSQYSLVDLFDSASNEMTDDNTENLNSNHIHSERNPSATDNDNDNYIEQKTVNEYLDSSEEKFYVKESHGNYQFSSSYLEKHNKDDEYYYKAKGIDKTKGIEDYEPSIKYINMPRNDLDNGKLSKSKQDSTVTKKREISETFDMPTKWPTISTKITNEYSLENLIDAPTKHPGNFIYKQIQDEEKPIQYKPKFISGSQKIVPSSNKLSFIASIRLPNKGQHLKKKGKKYYDTIFMNPDAYYIKEEPFKKPFGTKKELDAFGVDDYKDFSTDEAETENFQKNKEILSNIDNDDKFVSDQKKPIVKKVNNISKPHAIVKKHNVSGTINNNSNNSLINLKHKTNLLFNPYLNKKAFRGNPLVMESVLKTEYKSKQNYLSRYAQPKWKKLYESSYSGDDMDLLKHKIDKAFRTIA